MKIQDINFIEIEAVDSRKLTPEALYKRRLQYVRFRTAGLEGLKAKRRGFPQGYNRFLTLAQEEEIQAIMACHTPDEVGLPYSLWSREASQRLIAERYGIKLALRTMTLWND